MVRKHRLAERLLVDIIGLDWDKAHLEAGRWEHVISDDVEEPPGRPARQSHHLPPRQPDPRRRPVARSEQRCLAEAQPGERIRLERITESVEHESASLSYLGDHGLTPGTTATIQAKAPDGTLTLVVGDATVALGPAMTQQLVRRLGRDTALGAPPGGLSGHRGSALTRVECQSTNPRTGPGKTSLSCWWERPRQPK